MKFTYKGRTKSGMFEIECLRSDGTKSRHATMDGSTVISWEFLVDWLNEQVAMDLRKPEGAE